MVRVSKNRKVLEECIYRNSFDYKALSSLLALLVQSQYVTNYRRNKELITYLLTTAITTITSTWKSLQLLTVDQWHNAIWQTALLEKLTQRLKVAKAQKKHNNFYIWWDFIDYTNNEACDRRGPLVYSIVRHVYVFYLNISSSSPLNSNCYWYKTSFTYGHQSK